VRATGPPWPCLPKPCSIDGRSSRHRCSRLLRRRTPVVAIAACGLDGLQPRTSPRQTPSAFEHESPPVGSARPKAEWNAGTRGRGCPPVPAKAAADPLRITPGVTGRIHARGAAEGHPPRGRSPSASVHAVILATGFPASRPGILCIRDSSFLRCRDQSGLGQQLSAESTPPQARRRSRDLVGFAAGESRAPRVPKQGSRSNPVPGWVCAPRRGRGRPGLSGTVSSSSAACSGQQLDQVWRGLEGFGVSLVIGLAAHQHAQSSFGAISLGLHMRRTIE